LYCKIAHGRWHVVKEWLSGNVAMIVGSQLATVDAKLASATTLEGKQAVKEDGRGYFYFLVCRHISFVVV
jgi:hypothetical protein